MNKLHSEDAALALIDAGTKPLKGKVPVKHAFLTRAEPVTSAIIAKFEGEGGGCT